MSLSLTNKVTTGTWNLALFIWNVAPVVCDVPWYLTGLVFRTAPFDLDISSYDKSSSTSQLIYCKSRDLQKFLK